MTSPPRPTLRRELGRWDLTAIGVNQVIGASIFALPGTVALHLGGWSWIAAAVVGAFAMVIALCFAEAGSRFEGTGGAYLYTRAAIGRFAGFEVGWMLFVTRTASWASVVNALADALGYYWPELRTGAARAALISAVVISISALNIRGIRQSAVVVNVLTIAKLAPLVIFIVLGLPHLSVDALRPDNAVSLEQISTAALLLIFAYGGFEVIPVPAGEARDPIRAVPFAMIMTLVIVVLVTTLVQVVALGTLPTLAGSKTPLAEASALFLGGWAAVLMTAGASVSMTGNNVGQSLSGSRNLFALAEQGDLPRIFGRIHDRFRTPDFSIVFMAVLVLALALVFDFQAMARVSAVARLVVYASTCVSVLALRRGSGPAPFTVPLGPVLPVLGLVVCGVLMYGATAAQLRVGAYFMIGGAALYVIARRSKSA